MARFTFRNLFRRGGSTPLPTSRRQAVLAGADRGSGPPALPVGRLVGFSEDEMGSIPQFFQESPSAMPPDSPFSIVAPPRAEAAPTLAGAFGSWKPNDGAFTVGELAALVPPDAVRNGAVPDHQEVALPLQVLRASLAAGCPAILLSQLHEACPAAFHGPSSPHADPVINLPPQKVRRLVEQSAAAAPAPATAEPVAVPEFAVTSPWQTDSEASRTAQARAGRTALPPPRKRPEEMPGRELLANPGRNAFSPLDTAKGFGVPSSPFEVADSLPSEPAEGSQPRPTAAFARQFESPFAVVSVGEIPPGVESPFARQPVAVAPPTEEPEVPVPSPESESAEPPPTLSLRLAELLRPLGYDELGFAPERVPERVRVELPADPLLRQLPSGRVTMPLAEVIACLSDRIRPAFQNARPGLQLTVPLREIFDALPGAHIEAPAPAPIETVFATPFAIKAAEDEAVAVPLQVVPSPVAEESPLGRSMMIRDFQTSPAAAPILPFVIAPEPTPPPEALVPQPAAKPETVAPAAAGFASSPSTLPLPPISPFASAPGRRFDFGLGELPMPPLDEEPIPMESLHDPAPKPPVTKPFVAQPSVTTAAVLTGPPPAVSSPTAAPHFSFAPPPVVPPVAPVPPIAPLEEAPHAAAAPSATPPPPPVVVAPPATPVALPIALAPQPPPIAIALPDARPDALAPQAAPEPAPAAGSPAPLFNFGPSTAPASEPGHRFGIGERAMETVVLDPSVPLPAADLAAEPVSPSPFVPIEPPAVEEPALVAPSTATPVVTPAPASAPAAAAMVEDLSFGYVDDPTQLALRAIFSTDQTLRTQDVVDLSSQFPGLRSCLILTPHATVHSGGPATSDDILHFRERAGGLFEKTASLVRELDPTAREQMFTLRTAKGVVSFFAVGDICLATLHAEPNFQPGVREKLILVSRSLAEMLGA